MLTLVLSLLVGVDVMESGPLLESDKVGSCVRLVVTDID